MISRSYKTKEVSFLLRKIPRSLHRPLCPKVIHLMPNIRAEEVYTKTPSSLLFIFHVPLGSQPLCSCSCPSPWHPHRASSRNPAPMCSFRIHLRASSYVEPTVKRKGAYVCVSPFGLANHATPQKTTMNKKPMRRLHLQKRGEYVSLSFFSHVLKGAGVQPVTQTV